jgi:hypothetical protein
VLRKPSKPHVILDAVNEALGIMLAPVQTVTPVLHQDDEQTRPNGRDNLMGNLSELEEINLRVRHTAKRGLQLVENGGEVHPGAHEIGYSLNAMQAVSLQLSALVELALELGSHYDPLPVMQICCRAEIG